MDNHHPGLDRSALIRIDREGRPFVVRDFRPEDRDDLARFYENFQPKRVAQGLPPEEPERIGHWLNTVLKTGIHRLALRDGDIIGHCFITPTRRPTIGEYAIFLRDDQRGLGVGTELNRVAVKAGRDLGLGGLWLTVEPSNRAAIRSYQKAGFRFVPETLYSIEPEMETMFSAPG